MYVLQMKVMEMKLIYAAILVNQQLPCLHLVVLHGKWGVAQSILLRDSLPILHCMNSVQMNVQVHVFNKLEIQ